mmetsp:Transcript_48277/g.56435  ORF Transcript_48277/g.56435 Transcript_48277/m.56435 type:complete len:202 (+) Transcript_48277:112-717(+)
MVSGHNTLKVGVQLDPEEVQILENIKANKKVVESLQNMNINWRIVNNTWDDVATEYPSKGCQLSSNEEDELNKAYHELQHKPLTSFLRRYSSSSIDGDKISKKKDELSKTHHELKSKPVTSFLGKSLSLSSDKRDDIQSSSVTVNQSLLYPMNSNALNTSKLQTFYRDADTKVTYKGIRQPLVTAACRARVNANIKTNTAA